MSKPSARRPYANFVVLDVFFTDITVLWVEVHHRLVESTTTGLLTRRHNSVIAFSDHLR
jgi:hypothetical protein